MMASLVQSPAELLGFGSPGPTMGATSRGSLASREKRTFKDKLHIMILEAEAAEQQALRESQLQDKKSLSIQLLVEGRPQAFTDFFNLTHPPPVSSAHNQGEGTSGQDDVPQEALGLLKNELLRAENALRVGDLQSVYSAYKCLAKYFAQIGKLRKAEFFFQRCLGISQEGNWLAGELEANLALGVVYEELQDTPAAIERYEQRLALAGENGLALERDTAYTNLTAAYLRQAQAQEAAGDTAAALDCYAKCLSAAERCGDLAIAARSHYRTGMLYYESKRYAEAIASLRRFTELSSHLDDKEAEGVAYTTFAECLREMGDPEAAVASLEEYLQAARGGDQHGPAMASCSLGILYYQRGDLEQAVAYFERFFEVARTLRDRKMLDVARVNLGVARGALRMPAYMHIVSTELPQLLQWKNSRVPFTDH